MNFRLAFLIALSSTAVRAQDLDDLTSTLDTRNARNLRFEAGQAVRHGLAWERALRAVTLAPARVLGIEATHGSLEAGKTANVVVWSGDPFEPASEPERVFIRGREIEKDSRQRRLLERYRTLP